MKPLFKAVIFFQLSSIATDRPTNNTLIVLFCLNLKNQEEAPLFET